MILPPHIGLAEMNLSRSIVFICLIYAETVFLFVLISLQRMVGTSARFIALC